MAQDIDFEAVSRIARRIQLRDIRLLQVNAHLYPPPTGVPLEPDIDFKGEGHAATPTLLSVTCAYSFKATAGGEDVVTAGVNYILLYQVFGEEEIKSEDIPHFAQANGLYHSWPFLRQLLYDLTSRMGLPALVLPVVHIPKRKSKEAPKAKQVTSGADKSKRPAKKRVAAKQ